MKFHSALLSLTAVVSSWLFAAHAVVADADVDDAVLDCYEVRPSCSLILEFHPKTSRRFFRRKLSGAADVEEDVEEEQEEVEDISVQLMRQADDSQRDFLEKFGSLYDTTQLWIVNALVARDVPAVALGSISDRDDIKAISLADGHQKDRDNVFEQDDEVADPGAFFNTPLEDDGWNRHLEEESDHADLPPHIQANGIADLWKVARGEGVRFAVSSTGIIAAHEAFATAFDPPVIDEGIPDYSHVWFDSIVNNEEPLDVFGVGSHLGGVMVGGTRNIGVAPDGKLLACRSIDSTFKDTVSAVVQCFQWFLAPRGDSSKRPDVVIGKEIVGTVLCILKTCGKKFLS